MIEVLKTGIQTSIQDLGRFGFRSEGIPVAGVMDTRSSKMANWLVGNTESAPVLEMTMLGSDLLFHSDTAIAITGADISPVLNGIPVKLYQTIAIQKGDRLTFGALKNGCRAYLAVAGGFDIEAVLGSCSTYFYANIGGFEGRAIRKGDVLKTFKLGKPLKQRIIPFHLIPKLFRTFSARFIEGAEWNYFEENSLRDFQSNAYQVQPQSNRMGYRLEGEPLLHSVSKDIISSGVIAGTIQIPGNGHPIVTLADAQTTGGYPRIGNIISVDLPYLAQLKSNDTIRFRKVSVEQAQVLLRKHKQNQLLEGL